MPIEHHLPAAEIARGAVKRPKHTMIRHAPKVTPPAGPVQGFYEKGAARFTGIPYARAARFDAPQPMEPWAETLVATRPAPACPQNHSEPVESMFTANIAELGFSEDCQNLSITVPEDAYAGDDLPVMVWIHGGSNINGAGDMGGTNPVILAVEQRVVVVSVTYRLGILGYLPVEGKPTNRGLLDQAEAFRWVRRNIAAFGGNPHNVTAFGQSAGADAIQHLLAFEEQLFDRAILQSPPAGLVNGRELMSAKMLKVAGSFDENLDISEVLKLESKILKGLLSYGLKMGMAFGVQHGMDGVPTSAMLPIAWQKKSYVPLLVGHTAEESGFFAQTLGLARALEPLGKTGAGVQKKLVESTTRSVYADAIDDFVESQREAGASIDRYIITWRGPGSLGAVHGVEVPLIFGNHRKDIQPRIVDGASVEQQDAAGRVLRSIWADFAKGAQVTGRGVDGIIEL